MGYVPSGVELGKRTLYSQTGAVSITGTSGGSHPLNKCSTYQIRTIWFRIAPLGKSTRELPGLGKAQELLHPLLSVTAERK